MTYQALHSEPFFKLGTDGNFKSLLYIKVGNKTRPVATTLLENFCIICEEHPSSLVTLLPLPLTPPTFTPVGRFTCEFCDNMNLGQDLLLPEEIKLAEWIVAQHNSAFAWTDDKRRAFDPQKFTVRNMVFFELFLWLFSRLLLCFTPPHSFHSVSHFKKGPYACYWSHDVAKHNVQLQRTTRFKQLSQRLSLWVVYNVSISPLSFQAISPSRMSSCSPDRGIVRSRRYPRPTFAGPLS